jgi:hypothetical protein
MEFADDGDKFAGDIEFDVIVVAWVIFKFYRNRNGRRSSGTHEWIIPKGSGACFIEKAYVHKELAAGTGLILGVPLLAEASGRLILRRPDLMSIYQNKTGQIDTRSDTNN